MNPVYEKLLKCYDCYKAKIDFEPKVAIVLGSGLGNFAKTVDVKAELPTAKSRAFLFPQCRDMRESLFSVISMKFLWC